LYLTSLTQASNARGPHAASSAPTQWTAAVTVDFMVAYVSFPLWVLHHVSPKYLCPKFTAFATTLASPLQPMVYGAKHKLEHITLFLKA
jgi:hypothetical protein